MFPDAEDTPASVLKDRRLPEIALSGPADLRFPELAVGGGHFPVLWASMPEAAVDEHGDLTTRKDNVRADPFAANHEGKILSKSEPGAMQPLTERHLGAGIAAAICPHRRRCVGAGWWSDQSVPGHSRL
jgi:hypothetical protein